MLIAIIGESCVGKSTLAKELSSKRECKIISGKEYLKLEKNPINAESKFKEILKESINGDNIIYVISEKEHLGLLPTGAFRIVMTCSLDVIKERFINRLNGHLSKSIETMLEIKHGMFDNIDCELKIESGKFDIKDIAKIIK